MYFTKAIETTCLRYLFIHVLTLWRAVTSIRGITLQIRRSDAGGLAAGSCQGDLRLSGLHVAADAS